MHFITNGENREDGTQMTVLYAVLHLLVDGVCAMAMFGRFIQGKEGYFGILLYNFCAFALQMPFGVVLDTLNEKAEKRKCDYAFLTAAGGVLCTIAGAVTHPVVLGIGNALFHVGGGVGTIREDGDKSRLIARLGIFVAPGALGLYFGTMFVRNGRWDAGFVPVSILLMLLLCVGMCCFRLRRHSFERLQVLPDRGRFRLVFCCLLVVILRSYIGMAVTFPWKTGILAGILSVLAVTGGKAAGGFLAAWKGTFRTAAVSLILAAVCYLFSSVMPVGLAALFLFNMTMPITLYFMVCAFPRMPGFAFGFLTFALFLGFLPAYLGMQPVLSGSVVGGAGSVLSLVLLLAGIWKGEKHDKLSD